MFPKRRSDITVREVDGELLVLDRLTEKVHKLNATATYVWEHCDGTASVAAIAKGLAAEFGVGTGSIENDVARIIAEFQGLGLLEGSDGGGEHCSNK